MLTVFAAELLNESVSMAILGSVLMLTNQEVLCVCVGVYQLSSISTIVYMHNQAKKGSIITVFFFFFLWPVIGVTCSHSAVGHFHSNITEYKQVVIGCCWSCQITYRD